VKLIKRKNGMVREDGRCEESYVAVMRRKEKETYSHSKGSAKVVEDNPRAGISSVVGHCIVVM
jgi:hypothetical protein